MNYVISSKIKHLNLNDQILSSVKYLQKQGFEIKINYKKLDEYDFYELFFPHHCSQKEITKCISSISLGLCELIVNQYKNYLINHTIKTYYYYFDLKEREIINKKTNDYLNDINGLNYNKWEREIFERLNDYFNYNSKLVIDGFINFRLKDFCCEIQLAVEDAVEDYILEREYNDFLDLLKYFVKATHPKISKLHVIFSGKVFKIFDDKLNPISTDVFDLELLDDTIEYEDLLITSLITMAPNKLVFHNVENCEFKNTIETATKIFGTKRVHVCNGCSECNKLLCKP